VSGMRLADLAAALPEPAGSPVGVADIAAGDGPGSMGWAVEIPADGQDGFTLCCGECGRSERFQARFMGCRVRELGRARREGWGFRDGSPIVPGSMGMGGRVERLCPVCAAIQAHARDGGLWGHLAHELRAFRGELAADPQESRADPRITQTDPAPPVHLHPSGQLDLFGHAL
jgi:hypothetical protein